MVDAASILNALAANPLTPPPGSDDLRIDGPVVSPSGDTVGYEINSTDLTLPIGRWKIRLVGVTSQETDGLRRTRTRIPIRIYRDPNHPHTFISMQITLS